MLIHWVREMLARRAWVWPREMRMHRMLVLSELAGHAIGGGADGIPTRCIRCKKAIADCAREGSAALTQAPCCCGKDHGW